MNGKRRTPNSSYNIFSDDNENTKQKSLKYKPNAKNKKKHMSIPKMIITDVIVFGIALCTFAYFHHVRPLNASSSGQDLPKPSPAVSQTADNSDNSNTDTGNDEDNTLEEGDFSQKWADKFTAGDPEITDNSYKGKNVNVTVTKYQEDDITYYVEDIYVKNIKYLKAAFAGGEYERGQSEWVLDMAEENDAISAITGDSYGFLTNGVVVRNGVLYRESLFEDVCKINYDGTMETYEASSFDLEKLKSEGAWQVWSFGPMLLENEEAMEEFNSSVNPKNPRSAIGYFEPGHYCFVLVDGRQPGYSSGISLKELSALFKELGCKTAYNLDGGQTASMTFSDSLVNSPYNGGRKASDIIYIADN